MRQSKSFIDICVLPVIAVALLGVGRGVAAAASATARPPPPAAVTAPAARLGAPGKFAVKSARQHYCADLRRPAKPDDNEDLKPMAIQIRDRLHREYCGS